MLADAVANAYSAVHSAAVVSAAVRYCTEYNLITSTDTGYTQWICTGDNRYAMNTAAVQRTTRCTASSRRNAIADPRQSWTKQPP